MAYTIEDRSILEAALRAFEAQQVETQKKIDYLKQTLGTNGKRRGRPLGKAMVHAEVPPTRLALPAPAQQGHNEKRPRAKRRISAAGRKAMSVANKKRWAAYRAAKNDTSGKASGRAKRKLSAAQLKAMRENAVKARAAQKNAGAA